MNKIELTGNISRINDNDEKFIWFDICRNEKYKDKDGNVKEIPSFFDAKIERGKTKDNELFKVGAFVNIVGIPNTYIDKNGIKRFYIFVYELNNPLVKQEKKIETTVSYDSDGVMVWNGKRCESTEATEEEIKELEDLLSEYE